MMGATVEVTLFDEFVVRFESQRVALRPTAQRLVAFLALRRRRHLRSYLAGTLWPDVTDSVALSRLRSTLWHVRQCGAELITHESDTVGLREDVGVDVDAVDRVLHRLRDDRATASSGDELSALVRCMGRELLPGWYEDWVVLERERIRQVRLHGLEAVASLRLSDGSHALALAAGLRAIQIEPLRESAHLTVARIHLAEGNALEALAALRRYETILREQLGVRPSRRVQSLVEEAHEDLPAATRTR